MAEESAFTRILNSLNAADTGVSEKTASANTTPNAATRLVETVRSVAASTNKTASAKAAPVTPAASLEQMAKQAQAAEQEQLVKEAHLMGAAMADGFMERFAQYDVALSGVKTASPAVLPEAQIQKIAEAAYSRAVQDMEKHAEAEFERGYQDQLQEIHKIAADMHFIGQTAASTLINEARKAQ
jgi:hypothetical protein